MEHCTEHNRVDKALKEVHDAGIRNDSAIQNFKDNWNQGRKQMREETEKIWKAMDTKLSAKAFAWIVGILVGIMMTTIGTQWIMLFNINEKVNTIAVNQGKIYGNLGLNGHKE